MRDKNQEGHTRRVTELTLSMARALEMSARDLVHVRRGAILHDIGKMGIPDRILLKTDPLTSEDWSVIRTHPSVTYELLSPIPYLRPAMTIPYCHHERWDGSGYPRGLRGDQIPLEARIFAVADVFDSLTTDRPYRKAWSRKKALEYIREQSGKHFDPQVVEVFLKLLGAKEGEIQ
jgi:putative nucleotidyltransferase with HDIG domain